MTKKLEGAGLRGQVAGETSLSTVGQIEGLAYRGHKIELLAEKATFEEVAYLLLYDKLPNQEELNNYKALLRSHRDLPDSLGGSPAPNLKIKRDYSSKLRLCSFQAWIAPRED